MLLRDRLAPVPVGYSRKVVTSVARDLESNLAALPLELARLNTCLAPPGPRIMCLTCQFDNQL